MTYRLSGQEIMDLIKKHMAEVMPQAKITDITLHSITGEFWAVIDTDVPSKKGDI